MPWRGWPSTANSRCPRRGPKHWLRPRYETHGCCYPTFADRLAAGARAAPVRAVLRPAVRRHGDDVVLFGQSRHQSERVPDDEALRALHLRHRWDLPRCAMVHAADRAHHHRRVAADRLSAGTLDGAHAVAAGSRAGADGGDRAHADRHRGAHLRLDAISGQGRHQHAADRLGDRLQALAVDVQRVRHDRGAGPYLRTVHGADLDRCDRPHRRRLEQAARSLGAGRCAPSSRSLCRSACPASWRARCWSSRCRSAPTSRPR